MTDMICRKSMQRCQTPGMCSPHGGCAPTGPETAAAIATLTDMGYTYSGGQHWKPPIGKKPDFDLIDRLRCQLEVSEDTRQLLRSCLAQAESELDAFRAQLAAPQPLPSHAMFKRAEDAGVSFATQQKCFKAWFVDALPVPLPANPRPAGCCCPPPGHTGIWGGAMCPVHQGLRRLNTPAKPVEPGGCSCWLQPQEPQCTNCPENRKQ